jgi:hypothetical protein
VSGGVSVLWLVAIALAMLWPSTAALLFAYWWGHGRRMGFSLQTLFLVATAIAVIAAAVGLLSRSFGVIRKHDT